MFLLWVSDDYPAYDPDCFHPDYYHETKHNFPKENKETQKAIIEIAKEYNDKEFLRQYAPKKRRSK